MIALIVAFSKNRVIGNKGMIPWKIKGEQKRFKDLTTGNVVVMGRRTYEEIGKPLPNRMTYIVSSTLSMNEDNCKTVQTLEDAIVLAGNKDVFIAGGSMLYKEALPFVDKMYITIIDRKIEGDTYFPEFNEDDFVITGGERIEGEIPYSYLTYEKIKKAE